MTHSMTGFARSSVTTGGVTITVELRSVNNRFLDLHIRCPDSLRQFEHGWRKKISDRVHRGKLELQIKLDDKASFGMADMVVLLSELFRLLFYLSDMVVIAAWHNVHRHRTVCETSVVIDKSRERER